MKEIIVKKRDVSNIYDIHLKVRINSVDEQKTLLKHLESFGFTFLEDEGEEVYGFVVGNSLIGCIYHKTIFDDIHKEEYSVDEILKLDFNNKYWIKEGKL